jgi:hypothetical protein
MTPSNICHAMGDASPTIGFRRSCRDWIVSSGGGAGD